MTTSPQAIKEAEYFDPDKLTEFIEFARKEGHKDDRIKAMIGARKADFKWKPKATPPSALDTVKALPGAIRDKLVADVRGQKENITDLGIGAKSSVADFYGLSGKAFALGERGARAVSPLPEGEPSAIEFILGKGRELAEREARRNAPTPEEFAGRDSFQSKLMQGIGAAPLTVGMYADAAILAGPVGGFAAIEALRESDKGLKASALGAARGALMGATLHAFAPLALPEQAVGVGFTFAMQTAVEGGGIDDVAVSFLIGMGLVGTSGKRGGITLRQAARTAIDQRPTVPIIRNGKPTNRSVAKERATEAQKKRAATWLEKETKALARRAKQAQPKTTIGKFDAQVDAGNTGEAQTIYNQVSEAANKNPDNAVLLKAERYMKGRLGITEAKQVAPVEKPIAEVEHPDIVAMAKFIREEAKVIAPSENRPLYSALKESAGGSGKIQIAKPKHPGAEMEAYNALPLAWKAGNKPGALDIDIIMQEMQEMHPDVVSRFGNDPKQFLEAVQIEAVKGKTLTVAESERMATEQFEVFKELEASRTQEQRNFDEVTSFFELKKNTTPLSNQKGAIRIPEKGEVGESVRDFLQLPDIKSHTYKSTQKAVEGWRITRNAGVFEAQQLQSNIEAVVPDPAIRSLIARSRENRALRKQLSPKDLAIAKQIWKMYDDYIPILKKEGLLSTFQDDYVNRIIRKAPDVIDMGAKTTRLGTSRMGVKPSFTRQRARKASGETYTRAELESFGYELENDIGALAALYKFTAEEAIANKRLIKHIEKAKAPDGTPALKAASQVPLEQRNDYFEIGESALKKWSGRQLDEKTRILFKEPIVLLHKDIWYTIDNVLADIRKPRAIYKMFAGVRSGVKRTIMFNPLIHGFNVESQVIMSLGHRYPKRLGFLSRLGPEGIVDLQREMVEGGVELEGLWDIRKRLRSDIYEPNLAKGEPSRNPLMWLKDKSDTLLWDKWVKSGQMIVFQDLKARNMRRGMSREEAIESAGNMTNDLMGTLPPTWFTKRQRKALFQLQFARNWTVSNLRTLTGALGPGSKSRLLPKMLRFEGMTDAQLKSMGHQYRRIILNGVIGMVATGNILQYMFLKLNGQEFHPTWENEEDHKFDIDTGFLDNRGRKIYLKHWLFRQIDDYAKLMQGHPIKFVRSKTEPLLRTGVEILLNTTYFEKPIVRRGMTRAEQVEAIGKYIVKGITPVDTFVGRDEEVRTWLEAIAPFSGTWVRHGLPTGDMNPTIGDIVKDYYEYKTKKGLMTADRRAQVKKLIQQGRDIEALALVDGENLTPQQYVNILADLKQPLRHRIMTFSAKNGWRVKADFLEFLITLPEHKQQKYLDALAEGGYTK